MRASRLMVAVASGALVLGLTARPGIAGPGRAGIRLRQQTSANTGLAMASSLTGTFATASAAHSLLVIVASSDGPEVQAVSVTDDGGNSWRPAVQIGFGLGGQFETQIWYAKNAAPAHSVTIDHGTFIDHLAMDLAEYTGVAVAGDPLDGFSTGSDGISGEECSTSFVPNRPNELAVGVAGTARLRKIGLAAPFSGPPVRRVGRNAARSGAAVLPDMSLVTFTATWGGAAAYDCVMVLFRPR